MILAVPDYYEQFVCTASACRDNCCRGGWQIDVDPDTVNLYRTVGGSMGERLLRAVQTDIEGDCFLAQPEGRCPFLLSDGLCEIHRDMGPDYLCVVCRQFPRFSEYYGATKESGLGLSCEEAARIILSKTTPLTVVIKNIDEEEYEDSEWDAELCDTLKRVRDFFFGWIWDSGLSGDTVLIRMLWSADCIQEYINSDDWDVLSAYVDGGMAADSDIPKPATLSEQEYADAYDCIWAVYRGQESIGSVWDDCAEAVSERVLPGCSMGRYRNCFDRIEYRNLMEYFVYRYFLKASYDYDVIGKIRFVVSALLIIRDMEAALGDLGEAVHIFSKQFEYLSDGVSDLIEDFMFEDVFETEVLASVI